MKLNLKKLRALLKAAQNERSDIEARLTEINQVLDGTGSTSSPAAPNKGKRTFSAATKAKMRAAAKERWAKRNGEAAQKGHAVKSGKRKMSAAGRARIAAAAKARWAKAKAAGKKTLKA